MALKIFEGTQARAKRIESSASRWLLDVIDHKVNFDRITFDKYKDKLSSVNNNTLLNLFETIFDHALFFNITDEAIDTSPTQPSRSLI